MSSRPVGVRIRLRNHRGLPSHSASSRTARFGQTWRSGRITPTLSPPLALHPEPRLPTPNRCPSFSGYAAAHPTYRCALGDNPISCSSRETLMPPFLPTPRALRRTQISSEVSPPVPRSVVGGRHGSSRQNVGRTRASRRQRRQAPHAAEDLLEQPSRDVNVRHLQDWPTGVTGQPMPYLRQFLA